MWRRAPLRLSRSAGPRSGKNGPVPSSRRSRRRPYGVAHPELDVESARGGSSVETGPDGTWNVRRVAGGDKPYRCPGCDQLIEPGVRHVVAWSAEHLFGADAALADRRHWHAACWRSRQRRRPRR